MAFFAGGDWFFVCGAGLLLVLGFLVGGAGEALETSLEVVAVALETSLEVVAAALETSLEVAAAALETSLEMVWMQPRLPTHCHCTEHYDDLAIEQLDLGWGRICYKKRNYILL